MLIVLLKSPAKFTLEWGRKASEGVRSKESPAKRLKRRSRGNVVVYGFAQRGYNVDVF